MNPETQHANPRTRNPSPVCAPPLDYVQPANCGHAAVGHVGDVAARELDQVRGGLLDEGAAGLDPVSGGDLLERQRDVRAALDAVVRWKYEPPTLEGKPVHVVMTVTMEFTES